MAAPSCRAVENHANLGGAAYDCSIGESRPNMRCVQPHLREVVLVCRSHFKKHDASHQPQRLVITLITQVKTVEHSYCLSFARYLIEMLIDGGEGLYASFNRGVVCTCSVSCEFWCSLYFLQSVGSPRKGAGRGRVLLAHLVVVSR